MNSLDQESEDLSASADDESLVAKPHLAQDGRMGHKNFAEKLLALLEVEEYQDIFHWLPNGESFCVVDQDAFEAKVMGKFFPGAKFQSFTRRLRRWGFHRIETTEQRTKGLIICTCPRFRRGRPDLCKAMCDDRQHKERSSSINPKARGNQPVNDIIYNDAAPVTSSLGGGQVIVNGWAQNQSMPVGVAPTNDMMQQNQFMPSQQGYMNMDPSTMMQPMGHPQMFQQNYWNPYQMQMNQQMMMQNSQMNQYVNYPMNPNEFASNQQPANTPFIHDPSSQFNQPQQPSVEPSIICNQSLHNHEAQPNNIGNDPFPTNPTDREPPTSSRQTESSPAVDSDANNLNSRIRANINRIEAELDTTEDDLLDVSKDIPLPHSIKSTNVNEIRENIRHIESELAEISRMRDKKQKSAEKNANIV